MRGTERGLNGHADIVVIGGGPAGMMAAIRASQLQRRVMLLEKGPDLGRKLLLSGKGRCNLTNAGDLDSFLERFSGRNGQFLRDAFKKFFNKDLVEFFESRGLALKVERQLRVFPVTDSSVSVLNILREELAKNKVVLHRGAAVKAVKAREGRVASVVLDGGAVIECGRVIIATGGVSYPGTGSTGDGMKMASGLGHTVVSPRPALVELRTPRDIPARLEGLTLKNIRVRFSGGPRKLLSDTGELLFTSNGISGPLVLSLSGVIGDWLAQGKSVLAHIDLKPALSREKLEDRIVRDLSSHPGKDIKNVLKSLLPSSLIEVFIDAAGITRSKKAAQITRDERTRMLRLLKDFTLEIKCTGPMEKAMITRGGVSLREIDPRTMESRIVKGLYFAGEVLDVDADTGGYNLQAAFSTGYLAGESAAGQS